MRTTDGPIPATGCRLPSDFDWVAGNAFGPFLCRPMQRVHEVCELVGCGDKALIDWEIGIGRSS